MKKIINIIVFALAGLACLLAIVFSSSFVEEKKEGYGAAVAVNETTPQMVTDLLQLDVAGIDAYVNTYSALVKEKQETLKVEKVQHDILYTFIYQLEEEVINEQLFSEYKAKFPAYSKLLFAKADNKEYINTFNNVASLDQLEAYTNTLRATYAPIHQDYLVKNNEIKNMEALLKKVTALQTIVSATKKEYDLNTLKTDVDNFIFEAKVINFTMILAYIVFFITFGSLVFFMLKSILTNIKGSARIIGGFALLGVVFFIGYAAASEEKGVNGGLVTFYFVFFSAILSIIVTSIMKFFKKA